MTTTYTHDDKPRPTPVADIPPSCVHEVFREVEQWERERGVPAIRLHVGEPAFRPSPVVAGALAAAVRDGRDSYTTAEGVLELREAVVAKLVRDNGHDTDPGLVFVTPGSTQGLFAIMKSLHSPGARLLLPAVHWPVHLQQCLLAGYTPDFYPLDEHMRPDPVALAALPEVPNTVLLLNTPSNPAGALCDAQLLGTLIDLARSRGWTVVSDEAYEDFAFDGPHVSAASLEVGLPAEDRIVFSAFSFSKSYAMTGYRLGYVVAPNEHHARTLCTVQEASIVCPALPVQLAGLAALGEREQAAANGVFVRATRDRALAPLVAAGLLAHLPSGGWYALLDCAHTGRKAEDFAADLLRLQGVALAPAAGFALRRGRSGFVADTGSRQLLRLAFCGAPEQVAEGAERIAAFVGSW
ncbi:aspartate aminotransferase [Crossiella equi]|uniref:Aminotransferase n=1 Tax=Crossiella equi TaxID=130796 RepID=A0ABS5ATC0_9PSEU|nr:pyridoxal phosphate-dependent aminotransferase [Crossiella equi]MBP2479706.1 aspartate aminotransferase [Crossiella equi]